MALFTDRVLISCLELLVLIWSNLEEWNGESISETSEAPLIRFNFSATKYPGIPVNNSTGWKDELTMEQHNSFQHRNPGLVIHHSNHEASG